MILNSIFTYEYNQPEDYRFSLDSVFLAQKVAEALKAEEKAEPLKVLDLCAGCGVIGMELHFHYPQIAQLDFVEIQEVYKPYFEENISQVKDHNTKFNFLNYNYADLISDSYANQYDCIVSNPPYFFIGEGILSPNEFKNRCRFFIDSDFETLIKSMLHVLKENGSAYILVRSGNHHGRDVLEYIKDVAGANASVSLFDEVRGTLVARVTKKL